MALSTRTFLHATLLGLAVAVSGCGHDPWRPPASTSAAAEPELRLVWVGRGEAERLENGAWVRVPAFDYDFSVEQRRYRDRWESVKSMRRHHPAYDGSAGPRDQTLYFHLALAPDASREQVAFEVQSTLGRGRGFSDPSFRQATLDLRADVGAFAPFDRYRISQSYAYEEGRLSETVELTKGNAPWVRNREVATLFAQSAFSAPPTVQGR